jgi:dCMP deaminase
MIINSGVRRIVYLEGYPDDLSLEMLGESAIEVYSFEDLAALNAENAP